MTAVRTRLLEGFDDPTFGLKQWETLLLKGNSDSIYLTWQFQRTWWDTFRRGELLLIAAERAGEVVALAPLYAESGMIYFLGTEFESDYLDFIGELDDPEILNAILDTARACVPDFLGFRFYFVPESSGTGKRLQAAADRLGFSCYEEEDMAAPVLELAGRTESALEATKKKSLLAAERFFRREGSLDVHHLRDGEAILPHLDAFFQQHTERWPGPCNPSRFLHEKPRLLIERFTRMAARTGWLRFTRIQWEGRPIAFHYGYCYGGRYFWGMPSFAIDLARHSPGQLLLRQVLLAAIEEGARCFDFGTGDQAFKMRFATRINHVRTWGLYPTSTRPVPGPREGARVDAI